MLLLSFATEIIGIPLLLQNDMKNLLSILCLCCSTFVLSAQHYSPTEKDYVAYLFAYFTGNAVEEEQVHYAISNDGYNYFALNENKPVLASSDISSTGGVRDPHILRRHDNRSEEHTSELQSRENLVCRL